MARKTIEASTLVCLQYQQKWQIYCVEKFSEDVLSPHPYASLDASVKQEYHSGMKLLSKFFLAGLLLTVTGVSWAGCPTEQRQT
jgi:hypothetical protein